MLYDEEKDYMMRMIREISRVLFSIIFGKQYTQVELERQDVFRIAGKPLDELRDLVDRGQINEAENILLEDIDYSNKNDVVSAAAFYEYLGNKTDDFLVQHDFSRKEVLDGLNGRIFRSCGYAGRQKKGVTSYAGDRDETLHAMWYKAPTEISRGRGKRDPIL